MQSPRVTVLMTVFKPTDYLEEAIRSFLEQSLTDFELIVSDDAPTDQARELCAKYASDGLVTYPNINGNRRSRTK